MLTSIRSTCSLALFLVLSVALAIIRPASAADGSIPRVTFEYSSLLDGPCYDAIQKPIDPAVVEELRGQFDEWRKQWERDGPLLLTTVVKLTGQSFKFQETKAALFTCPALPSMSLPPMINVRRFLKTTGGVTPAGGFPRLILHEVLHRYASDRIRELPGGTTPLLQKYNAESPVVRNHPHTLSLMEEVFRKLDRDRDLRSVQLSAASTASPGARDGDEMGRARQIIAAEHADAFVRELQGTALRPKQR